MNIKLEIHDMQALKKACTRLKLKMEQGKFKLFASEEKGTAVFLNNWSYPIVIKNNGEIAYDNYNGNWGKIEELNKLKAYYGIEKAKIEARKKGYSVSETYCSNTQELKLKIRLD